MKSRPDSHLRVLISLFLCGLGTECNLLKMHSHPGCHPSSPGSQGVNRACVRNLAFLLRCPSHYQVSSKASKFHGPHPDFQLTWSYWHQPGLLLSVRSHENGRSGDCGNLTWDIYRSSLSLKLGLFSGHDALSTHCSVQSDPWSAEREEGIFGLFLYS